MKHNTKAEAEAEAESAPAQAGETTIQGIDYKTALLEIGRMAQARKSCIRMPNGMMLDNYVGQALAYVPGRFNEDEARRELLQLRTANAALVAALKLCEPLLTRMVDYLVPGENPRINAALAATRAALAEGGK